MAAVPSLLFLLLRFWVDRFCCFLLLLLFWFTLCWSSAVTWELDIWKNSRLDLMVDSSRENAIICLWQELREVLRQGLLFQTTQAVKYDTLDCMRTSCGLWIQGKFCLFLHSGQIYFGFFFFFEITLSLKMQFFTDPRTEFQLSCQCRSDFVKVTTRALGFWN